MRSGAALAAVLAIVVGFGLRPHRVRVRLSLPAGLGWSGIAGLLTWGVTTALGAPAGVAIAAGFLVTPLPMSLRGAAVRRSRNRDASRWPDFLAAVRSRIATGAALSEATRAAARHIGGPFADLDRGGVEPFAASLHRARSEWADPVADRVITTLVVAAEVGGRHVDSVLSALAVSVADELRLRRAHDAALTQQRLTAGVALVAPWAMLGLSIATNPTAAESFASPTGTWIVLGGLGATVGGFVLARRSARLSEPPRVFT